MNRLLFACPQSAALAKGILDKSRASMIPDRGRLLAGNIQWENFPDGWPKLMIESVACCRESEVVFLASFDQPADVLTQLGVIYALPRYLAERLTVILPFFSTGTMERVDNEGEIATAKTLARMLSNIPPCVGGTPQLIIYDIHALAERFFFGDNIIPRLESAVPSLISALHDLTSPPVAIVFPDEGAWKRFGKQFKGFKHVICQKVRDGEKRVVTIKEGDPRGLHAVIVDDLVQTGGTLEECRKALVSAGAAMVSAFVTHAVFPNESWRQFIGREPRDSFANFWTTDSCPVTIKAIGEAKPFKVLSLADSLFNLLCP